MFRIFFGGGLLLFLTACSVQNNHEKMFDKIDQHSYAIPLEAKVTHLDLDLVLDFDAKTLKGTAVYDLHTHEDAAKVVFDTRNLNIESVSVQIDQEWKKTEHSLGKEQKDFGQPLSIPVDAKTNKVRISYSTNKGAAALQWLDKEQTKGGRYPFLFTQSQAILARTWLPCQDSPGIRMTYNAKVKVPKGMLAVMSASNSKEKSVDGQYSFEMKQAIPSYLMALAVGDLAFDTIGSRTGVYAEPEVLASAVYEFGNMEKMLERAEALYGPYRWERYDVIVLPPSFPFGGMENPRITFVTPTILSGDRSLTALIAHELAHSWSGNLVTNSTWDDFWLNEGFTVYFERRIMEELKGESYANMLAILGQQDLAHTLDELGHDHKDTHLKLDLGMRNPDDGLTDIAYEKGYFFLRSLESYFGRDKWDAFLKNYFNTHAFKTMTTKSFCDYLKTSLDIDDKAWQEAGIEAWIYSPGIPENSISVLSDRFEKVDEASLEWQKTKQAVPLAFVSKTWSTHEWLHFIRNLPESLTLAELKQLDQAFKLTDSGNREIACAWYLKVIPKNYAESNKAVETFLIDVGRRKFLTPLYKAILGTQGGKERAMEIYRQARGGYHAVSRETMDELLDWNS